MGNKVNFKRLGSRSVFLFLSQSYLHLILHKSIFRCYLYFSSLSNMGLSCLLSLPRGRLRSVAFLALDAAANPQRPAVPKLALLCFLRRITKHGALRKPAGALRLNLNVTGEHPAAAALPRPCGPASGTSRPAPVLRTRPALSPHRPAALSGPGSLRGLPKQPDRRGSEFRCSLGPRCAASHRFITVCAGLVPVSHCQRLEARDHTCPHACTWHTSCKGSPEHYSQ